MIYVAVVKEMVMVRQAGRSCGVVGLSDRVNILSGAEVGGGDCKALQSRSSNMDKVLLVLSLQCLYSKT